MDEIDEAINHMEEKLDRIADAESPFQKYILQIVMLIFVAGGGWVTLSNIEAMAEDNKKKIEQQAQADHQVEKKLERIAERQESLKEDVEELKKDNDKLDNKLDQILDELRNE
jgi:septal ring factor EnvC (AmiA/AmiB activator)